jgi:hypothetical protein
MVLADLPPEFFELKVKLDAAVWKRNENIRNRGTDAEYQRLSQEIERYDRKMADHKQAIKILKQAGISQLSDQMRGMITSGARMRFFVRLDVANQQLRVIGILDNPRTPPQSSRP